MKTVLKNKLFLLVFALPFVGNSQIINIGDLYISPNTVMSSVKTLDNTSTGQLINDGEMYLYSNYNNDGLASYTPGIQTGITKMYGLNNIQNITGSNSIDINKIEFNATTPKALYNLSNQLIIYGDALFNNGIVDCNNNTGSVLFEPNAMAQNANDNSHVDGYVKKNGNDPFTFPVGNKGYYNYNKIENGASASNSYTSRYRLENSNDQYPHSNKSSQIDIISTKDYWNITKNISNQNHDLIFQVNSNTVSSDIFKMPFDDIHIVGWDNVQNSWVDLDGFYDESKMEMTTNNKALEMCRVFAFARVKSTPNKLEIYNALSPNNDGKNDFFLIKGLENFADNTVQIFNRWGVVVYEKQGYDNNPATSFNGISTGRATFQKSEKLPEGVYFYIIKYKDSNSNVQDKSGYLYINY